MTQQLDFWVDDKPFIGNKSAHLITWFFAETAEYHRVHQQKLDF